MNKNILILLIVVGVASVGFSGYTIYKQTSVLHCEACGMLITHEIREHIDIVDESGDEHYACCQGCMFRLLDKAKGSDVLHIETYCDYYGPEYRITIDCSQNGNVTNVSPSSALVLLGAKVVQSCANNRIAYNVTAANMLMSAGYSSYTMSWQRNPLPQETPVLPVAMVAKSMAQKGIAYTPPSLTVPLSLGVIGLIVLAASVLTYRNLER